MPTLIPPGPSIINFFRSLREGREVVVTPELIRDSSLTQETSFAYEPITYPLKNTQQINLDWSRFENHVFFSSAEKKTEIAIDQIVNSFPFDGSKTEYENFFNNLTGFDKWLFDEKIPKFKGYLYFPAGQYIAIDDKSGSTHRALSRGTSGNPVVNPPLDKSFTIEFWVKPASLGTIFYKGNANSHIKVFTENIGTLPHISFEIKNTSTFKVSAKIDLIAWSHVAFVWKKTVEANSSSGELLSYVNGSLINTKENVAPFVLDIDTDKITLGATSSSFSIDELRIFHEARTQSQISQYYKKSVFATEELKLYYKFNEPPGFSLIIDSSGNSLHGTNSNALVSKEVKNEVNNPVPLEKDELCAVLFPSYEPLKTASEDLLELAVEYDKENPNLITKLIPQHYLDLGSIRDNTNDLLDADKKANYAYAEPGNPKQFKPDPVQIISSFLYIWARFFDEIKIYVDSFSTLNKFSYETEGTIPDNFLLDAINKFGFFMPPMLNNTSLAQFLDGEDIGDQITGSDSALKKIQSEITRRILVNLPQIIRSKGTHHSIRTFLKSVGINPNRTLRIREYGGATARRLSQLRERRIDDIVQFLFHKETNAVFSTNLFIKDGEGFKEKFLIEDWSIEGTFLFPEKSNSISLFSIKVNSITTFELKLATANEVSSLKLYGTSSNLICTIVIPNPFDDAICTIAFGRENNIATGKDRFFVRWGQENLSGESYSAESIVTHVDLTGDTEYKLNVSGAFRSSGIKMWTKAITAQEFSEHCKNFKSVGTDNAKDNFLFYKKSSLAPDTEITEKLKFNFIGPQGDKFSVGDELQLVDFSCNEHSGSITGLDDDINYFLVSQVEYSHLTPYFDEATTNDKIRVRGLLNPDPLNDPIWTGAAPYHEIPAGEDPLDDNRLSIEFSLIDALNRDIINIFSTLDEIETAIGSPELAFQAEYPDLEVLRNSYFEKLRDKMNFKGFFEFFRWFDQSISRFIEQLVPRKTHFKGTNFVIESHMLERSKLEIESSGMYRGKGGGTGIYNIIL
jgi:hypothetical protein